MQMQYKTDYDGKASTAKSWMIVLMILDVEKYGRTGREQRKRSYPRLIWGRKERRKKERRWNIAGATRAACILIELRDLIRVLEQDDEENKGYRDYAIVHKKSFAKHHAPPRFRCL